MPLTSSPSFFDVFIYSKIRAKEGEKKLWLRTTGSTVLSQLIDTFTFCIIAFWGMDGTLVEHLHHDVRRKIRHRVDGDAVYVLCETDDT